MKTVIFTHAAAKDLDALPREAREQIENALFRYVVSGEGDVKKLTGREGFRLRSGRYRVLFAEDQVTILAIYVGKRETTTYSKG